MLDTISNVVGNIDLAILHKVQEVFEEEGLVVGLFIVGCRLDDDLLVFVHGSVDNIVAALDLSKVSSAWPILIKNILDSLIVDGVRQEFSGDLSSESKLIDEVVDNLKLLGGHHGDMDVGIHVRLNELRCVTHLIYY